MRPYATGWTPSAIQFSVISYYVGWVSGWDVWMKISEQTYGLKFFRRINPLCDTLAAQSSDIVDFESIGFKVMHFITEHRC